MVVHISSDTCTDDGQEPKWNLPIGLHWVLVDAGRWQEDNEYYVKLKALYRPEQAPTFLYNKTPYDISLDLLSDDGKLLKIPHDAGSVGDHSDFYRHLIVSNTDQTGDIPHIAAAMIHDPMTDVLVICQAGKELVRDAMVMTYQNATKRDPAFDRQNLYRCLRNGDSRIRTLPQGDGYLWYPALIPDASRYGPLGPPSWRSPHLAEDIYAYHRGDGALVEYKMMYVGGATSLVAKAFQDKGADAFFAENSQKLSSDQVDPEDVVRFMNTAFSLDLKAEKQKYLLVWSRYSGRKPGGYNPAGDSSVEGNKQLVDLAQKVGRIAVTVGHDPSQVKHTPHGSIHLGEFWNSPVNHNPFRDKGRPAQTNFYVLFHEMCDVIQVGQKTGGMDNAALVGMRTVYIEDVDSPQQSRMEKWSAVMPHYRRAKVSRPPKRLGQAIRAWMSQRGAPSITHRGGKDFEQVREFSRDYSKGYSDSDLDVIRSQINELDQLRFCS